MRDSAVYLEITIQIDIWFVCGFLKEKENKEPIMKTKLKCSPKGRG